MLSAPFYFHFCTRGSKLLVTFLWRQFPLFVSLRCHCLPDDHLIIRLRFCHPLVPDTDTVVVLPVKQNLQKSATAGWSEKPLPHKRQRTTHSRLNSCRLSDLDGLQTWLTTWRFQPTAESSSQYSSFVRYDKARQRPVLSRMEWSSSTFSCSILHCACVCRRSWWKLFFLGGCVIRTRCMKVNKFMPGGYYALRKYHRSEGEEWLETLNPFHGLT